MGRAGALQTVSCAPAVRHSSAQSMLERLVLHCTNPVASARFYMQLGLVFTEYAQASGPARFTTTLGRTVLELSHAGDHATSVRLQLETPPSMYDAMLRREGVEPGAPLVLVDPDGNQVELTRAETHTVELESEQRTAAPSDAEFDLWLEFEEWLPGPLDDPTDDFFNMTITLRDGTRYALNVWTFAALETQRREAARDGHDLGGRYMAAPDLFVERLDRALLEAAVTDMLTAGRLKLEWLVEGDQDSAGVQHHCCARMAEAVSTTCRDHPDRLDCPDSLIHHSVRSNEYGLVIHDGGHSFVTIQFCPFCGTALPLSSR